MRKCGKTQIIGEILATLRLKFPKITKLDLGDNKIHELPFSFSKSKCFPKMKELSLDHNLISKRNGNFLSNFTELEAFIVSFNKISYIEPGFFPLLN